MSGFLVPKSAAEATTVAEMIAKSDLCPPNFRGKPGDVLIAMAMGAEVGLAPLAALQNIAVINGRPSIWGDAALAIVRASGALEDIFELSQREALDKGYGECRLIRKGQASPIVCMFSIEDAKTAKLWGKAGPWSTNPGRMLQLRARAFALRDGFADVLRGLYIREEVEDYESLAPKPARSLADLMPKAIETTIGKEPAESKAVDVIVPQLTKPKAESAMAVISSVDEKTSTSGKTYFEVRFVDGLMASTFSKTLGARCQEFIDQEVAVEIETKVKGDRTYHNILAVEPS